MYDALNRVITTTNALEGRTIIVYDEVGNRKQVIDARGYDTTFEYDSLYRLKSTTDAEDQTTHYSYDALGNRRSVTDPEDNTTTFEYDSLNRVVMTTNALSGTTHFVYDAAGNQRSVTDANGHPASFDYDDLNRLIETTDPNQVTTSVSYDGLGNRLSVTNGANETTRFEYDQANRLVLVRDPLDHETRFAYDGAGNRLSQTDAEWVVTRYGYDSLDRLTGVIENYVDGSYDPDLTDEDVRTLYEYDAVGNRTRVIDARNNPTRYEYDPLNRRIESRDVLDNVISYGYDAVGNRTVITDANLEITSFSYDKVNRLTGITYSDSTPAASFSYDGLGNRETMSDGSGTTTYIYDDLYRLTTVTDGANQSVGYRYDAVGNRTGLIYPDNRVVTYTYDLGNRLDTVEDWRTGQFGYDYDEANRLTGLSLPGGVTSAYDYDDAGRLTLLAHSTITETLASYSYDLDRVGNRRTLTETLLAVRDIPSGAYLENNGLVVMEAETGTRSNGLTHDWLLQTTLPGYTGTSYLQPSLDIDTLVQTNTITTSPKAEYLVNFTTAETYTVWVRGYAPNAAGDSVYIGLDNEVVEVTGFAPREWAWANVSLSGSPATLPVESSGVYTLSLYMREDGLRIDRLLLTTDTTYVPAGFGPVETERLIDSTGLEYTVDRAIEYGYDNLYRLISADYSTGEMYQYEYDPVGNRLKQIIDGDTTEYLYDAANRLAQVDGQSYTFDANGNLLSSGVMTNTWDAANRLVETTRDGYTLEPIYNGVGDRVGQTAGVTTTHFALDVQGLPEVIYTSQGEAFLHLPGAIMTESAEGEVRYLLSDGLGSIRQAVDETAGLVAYYEFDPYGNPVDNNGGDPYGYTGEWWESYANLLFLRARWYAPGEGIFLSRDPVENIIYVPSTGTGYNYANQNSINLTDPTGLTPLAFEDPWQECMEIKTCRDLVFIVLEEGGTAVPKAVISISAGVVGVLVIVPGGLTLICTVWDCSPAPSMPPQPVPTPRQDPSPTGTPIPESQPQQQPQPQDRQNPQVQTQPLPQPIPVPAPPPTCPEEPDTRRLHIALGLNSDAINNPILVKFTWNLNEELNPQNIYVYSYGAGPLMEGDTNWHVAGLSKVPPSAMAFFASFHEAAENAEGIHFNLEAIHNPVKFADTFGPTKRHLTAYELYYIKTIRPDLCRLKTKFYQKGSVSVTEDPDAKRQICGQ